MRLLPLILLLAAQGSTNAAAPAVDFAHVDSGATVVYTSPGCNPAPYDVRGALGDGEALSYPGKLPNSFVLDLGQMRTIRAIEIDWRHVGKGVDEFAVQFGLTAETKGHTIHAVDVVDTDKYWHHILPSPVQTRYVRFTALKLKDYSWTVLNRFSLYGTTRIPRLQDSMLERYEWLAPRVESLTARARAAGMTDEPELGVEARRFCDMLIGAGDIDQAAWELMAARFPELQQQAYDAEARISFAEAAAKHEGGWAVCAASPMRKVFRHIWPDGDDRIELCSARNEWESVQVAVAALDEGLEEVTCTAAPLRGPVVLAPEAISVELVSYVKTSQSPVLTHHIGWWPDGLTPAVPVSVPKGSVQPYWLTVRVPEDVPAGVYTSTITVAAQGRPPRTIPLQLTVWDFTLPTRGSLRNVFSLSRQLVEGWYRGDGLEWDQVKHDYYDFLLRRRINPTSLYGTMIPEAEDVGYCIERGMNAFVIKYIYSGGARAKEEYFQACLRDLAEWDRFLAAEGLHDRAIVYLADEPADKKNVTDEINRRSRIIHEMFPRMERMLVYHRKLHGEFDGSVDIWTPIVSRMDPEALRRQREAGADTWWYSVGGFFALDRPAIDARAMPWLSWKHGLEGILHWVLQGSWRKPNSARQFHPKPGEVLWETFRPESHANYNGIGNLIYPGPDGCPWSSIRLELLREGLEDYEYFVLLKKALETQPGDNLNALLSVPDDVQVTAPVTADAESLLTHRLAMGRMLHALATR